MCFLLIHAAIESYHISLLFRVLNIFIVEGAAVESLALSLCCCLERLVEGNKAIHQASLQYHSLMAGYLLIEHTSALDVTSQLQQTLCHKTALYCKKLMKVQ